jgi:hypothetical protein
VLPDDHELVSLGNQRPTLVRAPRVSPVDFE